MLNNRQSGGIDLSTLKVDAAMLSRLRIVVKDEVVKMGVDTAAITAQMVVYLTPRRPMR